MLITQSLLEQKNICLDLENGLLTSIDWVDTISGIFPACSGQANNTDCGLYVLQYVESFFMVSPWCMIHL